MGSFWANYILFELKKYRGITFHETEKGYRIWSGIDLSFQNWYEKFDKFWPEHSKVSKIFILMGSFWAKLCVMTMKNDTKIKEELTCHFKIDMYFTKFDPSTRKVWNFFFNWLLLSKAYIVWATKVQRSYLSWQWGVMQILKKDWPVVWKKTWEIWQIFSRALESVKIGTLMGSFCPK